MAVTSRQLNRATLARQLLLQREQATVVDAVRRVLALQAQEPASPYIALWNRLADFDPTDLDAAFADGAIVKASLMRITLHAVASADHPTFREAVLGTLRAAGLHDRRFKETGLSIDDADALIPALVGFVEVARSRAEIEELLGEQLGSPPAAGLWRALRMSAPWVHAPTGGAWSFGTQPSFRAAPTRAAGQERDRAVERLLRRYLEAFGPASTRDFAQYAMLRQPTIRPAVAAMADSLVTLEGPDGAELLDVPGAPLPAEDTPAPPRLLPMWDSTLLAYVDRSRVIPEEYRRLVIRRNGDVLPTLLVDGYVAGVWRPVDGGIEAQAFEPLPDDDWEGLAGEARNLTALLADRDAAVYRRYVRWFSDLPSADTRVLPG
jgi:hypothetical protein